MRRSVRSGPRRSEAQPRRHVRRHLRAIVVAVVGFAALIAGAGFGTPALRPIGIALIVTGVLAIVGVEVAARTLRITRSLDRTTVTAGEPIRATLRLTGWAPRSGLLRLLDWDAHVAGPDGASQTPLRTIRSGADILHHVTIGAVPRGEHTLGSPWVAIADPFGLVRVRRAVRSSATLLAVARTVPVGLPFWEGASRRMGDAVGRARGRVELSGIRDYEPGDPLSLIHWTQTARRGRLQTKELHGESGRGRRLMIVLDAMPSPEATSSGDFEVAVSAAASLVSGCAARGTAVGLAHGGGGGELWPIGSPIDRMERSLALVTRTATESAGVLIRQVAAAPEAPDLVVIVSANDDAHLVAAVNVARTSGIATAAVLIADARRHALALSRSGAVVTEAATFEQLAPALDLMAVHA